MRHTALIWDERYMWFDFGSFGNVYGGYAYLEPGTTAETSESKRRIINLLSTSGLLDKLQLTKPVAASREQLALVHSEAYVDRVIALSAAGGGHAGRGAPLPAGGYPIAALAAGGVRTAIDTVIGGTARNAYALVRPPGHHAERDQGMSLCVFSNVAVAVRSAMQAHALRRVAILDWDAHHGNGTESAFYGDPDVLTLSIHQDQMIPGRGLVEHSGSGAGIGCNINIPLPPGAGTGAYLAAFERVILPALQYFAPELIVVASGLDAAMTDPTSRLLLLPDSYREMTRLIREAAETLCEGRLVMAHEGGYDPTITPFCALRIMEELSGVRSAATPQDNPLEATWGLLNADYQQLQPYQEDYIRRAEAQWLRTR